MNRNPVLPILMFTCIAPATISLGCGGETSQGGSGGQGATTTSSKSTSTSTTAIASTTAMSSSSTGMLSCPNEYAKFSMPGCDVLQQDCEAGKTCRTNGTTTQCVPATGLKTVGLKCTSQNECAAGLFCFDVCTPACCPPLDGMPSPQDHLPCLADGGRCNLEVDVGTPDDGLFFTVCTFSESCTLFEPSSCPDPADCHPAEAGLATCSNPAPDPKMEGEACMFVNQCGDSQACIGAQGATFFCRYVCQMGSNAMPGLGGCPAGQTCQNVDFGFPGIGGCLPP